jgi:hypothetical protein
MRLGQAWGGWVTSALRIAAPRPLMRSASKGMCGRPAAPAPSGPGSPAPSRAHQGACAWAIRCMRVGDLRARPRDHHCARACPFWGSTAGHSAGPYGGELHQPAREQPRQIFGLDHPTYLQHLLQLKPEAAMGGMPTELADGQGR